MDVQWHYKRGQGVIYVMCHYGIAVWGQGLHQEIWYAVDDNVINSALHGAKQVVVKFGHMYHLVIHQAIYIPNLDHHLLCSMQCRVNDIIINGIPKFLMKTPTPDSHSIVAHNINNPSNPLVLTLYIHGVREARWLHC